MFPALHEGHQPTAAKYIGQPVPGISLAQCQSLVHYLVHYFELALRGLHHRLSQTSTTLSPRNPVSHVGGMHRLLIWLLSFKYSAVPP